MPDRWRKERVTCHLSRAVALVACFFPSPVLLALSVDVPVRFEAVLSADDSVLENPGFDLLVLRVEGIGDQGQEVAVTIGEVLRGRMEPGELAIAQWGHSGFGRPEEPRTLPEPGTQLLVAAIGYPQHRVPRLTVVATFAATRANVELARENMVVSPSMWPTLFLAIFAWIAVSLARVVPSRLASNLGIAAALVAAVATAVCFVLYERQMSPYVNIRLDMIFLAPAFLSAFAVPLVAWRLIRQRRIGEARPS